MTGSADCRDIRQALGVYVLGAIEPAERAFVDAHLSTCPDCREELAGLAGLPALLRRVPVAEAELLASDDIDELPAAQPDDQMLRSLLARTSRHRRERLWRGLAAAAAIVLVAGSAGAAGWDLLRPAGGTGQVAVGAPAFHYRSVSGTNRATLTSLSVRLAPKPWGTALDAQVRGVRVGTDCQFEVTDSAGNRYIVGGWTATYGDSTLWYPGATSIPISNMRSFQITSGGKVLVSVPMQ